MNSAKEPAPLIVTLKMDAASQFFFDELRKKHFPAHANYLKSHITLFHKLPSNQPIIRETLQLLAKKRSFAVEVSGLKHIGKGVVFVIDSPELQVMHKQLQNTFKRWLTRQDAQKFWPHITVQNKVTNFKSQQLWNELSARHEPFKIKATGLQSWLYLNGAWELQEEFLFDD